MIFIHSRILLFLLHLLTSWIVIYPGYFYCYSVAENKHKVIWTWLCVDAVTKVEIEAKILSIVQRNVPPSNFYFIGLFQCQNEWDDISFSAQCHLYGDVEDCDFVHPDRLEEEDELDGEPGEGEHGRHQSHEAHHPPLVPHALGARSSTDRSLKFLNFCCCLPGGTIIKLILKRRLMDPIMDPFISSPR